jgi:hypothetical protein
MQLFAAFYPPSRKRKDRIMADVDHAAAVRYSLLILTHPTDDKERNLANAYLDLSAQIAAKDGRIAELEKDAERWRAVRSWPWAQSALVPESIPWGPGTKFQTFEDVVDARADWYIENCNAASRGGNHDHPQQA